MPQRKIGLAITMAALAIVNCARAQSSLCPEQQGMKPEQLLKSLEGDRATLKSRCIVNAINQLGEKRYAPAADTLTTYLDFRMPGTENKGHEIFIVRIPALGDKYPAATALFEIGKAASPSLVRAIADSSTPELLRDNAVEVLFDVYRENLADAVSVLNRASRSASDAASSMRLWDAARKEAGKCPSELRPRCEEALYRANR